MRKLIAYPNFSKGGVTSVIRGRAVASPSTTYDAVFFNDKGGADAFDDLANVEARLPRRDRIAAYLSHISATRTYDSASILSAPELVDQVSWPPDLELTYEFHSSDLTVISKELRRLDTSKIDRVIAPSRYMADKILSLLSKSGSLDVEVVPNLVDTTSFYAAAPRTEMLPKELIPLVWVGRFDKGKGYRQFVRLLSILPEDYLGIVVVSLESDPARAAAFLSEVSAAGVSGRIRLLLNIPQKRLGELYREAAGLGGWLVSTSLQESFGYSIAEALATKLPVASFELPPFHEHEDPLNLLQLVDIGDVMSLRDVIIG